VPSYNEQLGVTGPGYSYFDGSAEWVCASGGLAWYITISGGQPNTSFTSNYGNGTLDGSGSWISNNLAGNIAVNGVLTWNVNFSETGNSRSLTIRGEDC
jgi:hypothetical protein